MTEAERPHIPSLLLRSGIRCQHDNISVNKRHVICLFKRMSEPVGCEKPCGSFFSTICGKTFTTASLLALYLEGCGVAAPLRGDHET
jgi:hypothetical protein